MRKGGRVDPSTFDLTKLCPDCGYKIPPAEIMHLDSTAILCPKCKTRVPYGIGGASTS